MHCWAKQKEEREQNVLNSQQVNLLCAIGDKERPAAEIIAAVHQEADVEALQMQILFVTIIVIMRYAY